MTHILALDLGTTSTRAVVFDDTNNIVASHSESLTLSSPQPGYEEQDAMDLVQKTIQCAQACLQKANLPTSDIAALGMTNQRETTVIWDADSGQPLQHAIVWKDSRTHEWCKQNKSDYAQAELQAINGCPLAPYFSASKIRWLLDRNAHTNYRIGTLDCFLLWHLTGGKQYATDISNASRTALLDCQQGEWSDACLEFFNIPRDILPAVMKTADDFGATEPALFGGAIAIRAMIGDQQAALVGQHCLKPGQVKCTYGTGSFLMVNTGEQFLPQENLIATVAYEIGDTRYYGQEGGGFCAGSMLEWLKTNFQLFDQSSEINELVKTTTDNGGVYLIPAFSGLGAPYWTDKIGAELGGLTLATTGTHILRATLEAIANQSWDICQAMPIEIESIRIDGGVANSDWICQYLADITGKSVIRPENSHWITALGAAQMARFSLANSIIPESQWPIRDEVRQFQNKNKSSRKQTYQHWKEAIARYCNIKDSTD
jgi:glycerol kinase